MTSNAFAAAARRYEPPPTHPLARYRHDPAGFARECVDWPEGEALTDYQVEILAGLVANHRMTARGPHGLGKTTISALAVLWFGLTRDAAGVDWKAPTTAGAWRQLEQYLWPEIHKWAHRLRWNMLGRPAFDERTELQTLNLKLRHGSAFAVASDNPALIEGAHADEVLFVFDEAKSISAGVFDAAEGAFSGATSGREAFALAMSTPGEPVGRFYDLHARKPGLTDWAVRPVTLTEAVTAGRVAAGWAERRAAQWGADSALYANRVLGEFHADDEAGIVPLAWVEAANERWRTWTIAGRPVQPGQRIVGVDVARSGADSTVLAIRQGDVVQEVFRYSYADTMATVGRVKAALTNSTDLAVVDVIGVGAGVVDRLREQGQHVLGFHASERAAGSDRSGELGFLNARAAAWWRVRELLDPASGATVALPPDDLLLGDLTAPRWTVNSRSQIQVESKDDIRKRLGRSTDTGDAVVQSLWLPSSSGMTSESDFAVPYGTVPLNPSEAAVPYDSYSSSGLFADEWPAAQSALPFGWTHW